VGDFYETFNDDAVKASEILDIVLTKRANGKASHVQLAGFPHHALDTYLPKLVRAGQRVAICDQLEEPQKGKKLVKRGVTELVTPGVTINDKVLESRRSNYLAAIAIEKNLVGVSFLDISTGEFMVAQGDIEFAQKLVQGLQPSEFIFAKPQRKKFEQHFGDNHHTYTLDEWIFTYDFGYDRLLQHFQTNNLKGFGIEGKELAIAAAGSCLYYLEQTHHDQTDHISSISRIDEDTFVWMDNFTVRNLELIYPSNANGKSLLDIVDHTNTPMGGRLLKKWLVLPLKSVQAIQRRQDVVSHLIEKKELRNGIIDQLKQIGDLERLISKVAVQRINPREVVQLKRSLDAINAITSEVSSADSSELSNLLAPIHSCDLLIETISTEVAEDPPALIHRGGVIADGVNEELDEYRRLAFSGKDYLVSLQQREIEATGIPSLKIAFNNVFGYYIEVKNTHKDKVPEEWIWK